MFHKILIAYDGSAGADRALQAALELACRLQAAVCALTVADPVPQFAGTIDEVEEEHAFAHHAAQQHLDRALRQAEGAGVPMHGEIRTGHTIHTILDYTRAGQFDLVVLGHSGQSGVWATFLGTTAERVSRSAPCTVLIVR
jgi:nucleotide-binding universal stress UspA family protein